MIKGCIGGVLLGKELLVACHDRLERKAIQVVV